MNRISTTIKQRLGIALVWVMVGLTVTFAIISLAVDYGRVQAVKSELHAAADSAALAAVNQISDTTTALTVAKSAAAQNSADNSSVTLLDADVEFGVWDATARTFAISSSSPNAVRITARRTAARGNAPLLYFASLIGQNTCDVTATSIAYKPASSYGGFTGLDRARYTGSGGVLDLGQYNSATAGTSTTTKIYSNSEIKLSGSILAYADLEYGPSGTYSIGSSVSHSGKKTRRSANLSYSDPDPGTASSTNNNSSLPAGMLSGSSSKPDFKKTSSTNTTIPSGTYYLNKFEITAGTITFSGPVTLYFSDSFKIDDSCIKTYQSKPKNLKIYGIGSGNFDISDNTLDFYADVYAPQKAYSYSGMKDFWGRAVFYRIDDTGAGCMYSDESLAGGGASNAQLVK